MTLRPIVAICGTTGVGKSKLAIELALSLSASMHRNERTTTSLRGARIINADAMQVYSGMDILTNKVPLEEQRDIDHLLMGFKKPGEQYVIGQWIRDAMDAIEETHQRNQLPIIVGGTSYWIQHLVFPGRLVSSFDESDSAYEGNIHAEEAGEISEQLSRAIKITPPELLEAYHQLPESPPSANTNPEEAFKLHSLLASLDPVVASRWHWKDTRKVLRSLQIIKQSGKLSSNIIQEQSKVAPEPRYRTLFLWLYARPEILNLRLDARVDEMMERGLLREVEELTHLAAEATKQEDTSSRGMDYTLGIYQSIGYREFSQYLLNPDTQAKERMYSSAVERMKISTRKYAKRQVRWIRNTLLPEANSVAPTDGDPPVVPVYLLDATELENSWEVNVRLAAERILQEFISWRDMPDPLSFSDAAREMLTIPEKLADPASKLMARRKVVCSVCTLDGAKPVMIEEGREWQAHIGTRLHRRLSWRMNQKSFDVPKPGA